MTLTLTLAVKAYFVQNWIHLSYICTAPYVLIILVYVFLVPESARWLHLNNRNDEAMIVLRNIAKWNRRKLPDDVYLPIKLLPDTTTTTTATTTVSHDNPNLLPNEPIRRPQRNIFDLFKTKKLLIRTTANSLLWACGSLQVYGLQVKKTKSRGFIGFVLTAWRIKTFKLFYRQIDFSSRPGVVNEILEIDPKSFWTTWFCNSLLHGVLVKISRFLEKDQSEAGQLLRSCFIYSSQPVILEEQST